MLKLCRIIGLLVFLALMFTSCGAQTPPPGTTFTFYAVNNGARVYCTLDTCKPPVYAEGGGATYYCPDKNKDHCTPTTPPPCKSVFVYDELVNKGQNWSVVPPQQQDQNNSSSPAQVTFTSTTSKTVTVTDSVGVTSTTTGSLSGSVGPIRATITQSVKVEINASVSISVTASIGNNYNFTVPAGETAYANYGVKVQVTKGHLYDKAQCEGPGQHSDWGIDTTYVPIAVGWCVWTNKQFPCPSL